MAFNINNPNINATLTRPTDFLTEVSEGLREGLETFTKFGNNLSFGGTNEVIASFGGTFEPMATAKVLSIISTSALDTLAGTGAQQITITGIDENREVQEVTYDLQGLVSFNTTELWFGVNRAVVSSAGSTKTNQGDINITSADTNPNQAQIPAGKSTTKQLIFHTPITADALVYFYNFTGVKATNGNARIDILGYLSIGGVVTEIFDGQLRTDSDVTLSENFKVPLRIPAGASWWAECSTDSGTGSVSGRIQQILIDK